MTSPPRYLTIQRGKKKRWRPFCPPPSCRPPGRPPTHFDFPSHTETFRLIQKGRRHPPTPFLPPWVVIGRSRLIFRLPPRPIGRQWGWAGGPVGGSGWTTRALTPAARSLGGPLPPAKTLDSIFPHFHFISYSIPFIYTTIPRLDAKREKKESIHQ